ncbi:hypothetical protein HDV05_005889 [Chytridiales sp. JEL 0842]|nr:hypothetical protein HDV05_005889 [Chytridiales sp. JEL 0842]
MTLLLLLLTILPTLTLAGPTDTEMPAAQDVDTILKVVLPILILVSMVLLGLAFWYCVRKPTKIEEARLKEEDLKQREIFKQRMAAMQGVGMFATNVDVPSSSPSSSSTPHEAILVSPEPAALPVQGQGRPAVPPV